MGLLQAALVAGGSVLADQWRDYFYCPALSADVLLTKGVKKAGKGNENVISNGSIIAVNEGQCMILVDQGQITEICAEAGEFVYDVSTEPSVFYGDLGENIVASFKEFGKSWLWRFSSQGSARLFRKHQGNSWQQVWHS